MSDLLFKPYNVFAHKFRIRTVWSKDTERHWTEDIWSVKIFYQIVRLSLTSGLSQEITSAAAFRKIIVSLIISLIVRKITNLFANSLARGTNSLECVLEIGLNGERREILHL